jgi:hypothetical protein
MVWTTVKRRRRLQIESKRKIGEQARWFLVGEVVDENPMLICAVCSLLPWEREGVRYIHSMAVQQRTTGSANKSKESRSVLKTVLLVTEIFTLSRMNLAFKLSSSFPWFARHSYFFHDLPDILILIPKMVTKCRTCASEDE